VLQCLPILKEEGVKGGNFSVSIPKEKMIAKKPPKKNHSTTERECGWLGAG
jgi:hypothetical protein